MLNLFSATKIDKLKLVYDRRNVNPDTRQAIASEIKKYFPVPTISQKGNNVLNRFTPTKLQRGKKEVTHNLQMPEENELKEALWNIALQNTELLDEIWNTEIHLPKDLLLQKKVREYIIMLYNKPYSRLTPELIESDEGICGLYLHYNMGVASDNHPKFLIKFYDKVEEYYSNNCTYIAELYEPPSEGDKKKLGKHYNPKNNTIYLKGLNWLRIEIEFHGAPMLLPIAKALCGKAERLNLTHFLLSEGLYDTLDEVFTTVLKREVFNEYVNKEDILGDVAEIRKLAWGHLAEGDDFYTYKNIAKELGIGNQFAEIASLVKKIKPETTLYDELCRELFPDTTSSRLIQNDWLIEKNYFRTPKVPKRYALSYPVPVLDDS